MTDPATIKRSVQQHVALLELPIVSLYHGAAVSQLAVELDVTPREVVERFLSEGVYDRDDWPAERERIRQFTHDTRALFREPVVAFTARRNQG